MQEPQQLNQADQSPWVELGPLNSAVARRVEKLEDAPRRIWAHDPALWTNDLAGQAEIRQRMGWLAWCRNAL